MDLSAVLNHPDGVAIKSYLESRGTRIETVDTGHWWQGLPGNSQHFHDANNDTLLRLERVPGDFYCPRCSRKTEIPDTSKVWFLNMGFGVWINSGTAKEDLVEIQARVPFTFCQNHKTCRAMVFLYESDGLKAIEVEDARLGDFIKELLVARYKK